MQTYNELIAAKKIIDEQRVKVYAAEGTSPTWNYLLRVGNYLDKQATEAFREVIGQ